MTEDEFVQNRISLVQKYLSILKQFEGTTEDALAVDDKLRGSLERYLYLAIQSSIDLAEIVISKRKFRKAQSLGETFEILSEQGVIDPTLAQKLIQMVGFRNILSHGYHKIDYGIVCSVLDEGLGDIRAFLAHIEE